MSLQKFKLLATHCGTVAESPTRSPVIHLRRRKTLRMLINRSSDRWRLPYRHSSPEIQNTADESTKSDGTTSTCSKRDKIRSRRKLKELFVSSPPLDESGGSGSGGGRSQEEIKRLLPINGVNSNGSLGEELIGRRNGLNGLNGLNGSIRPMSSATLRCRLLRRAWRPVLVTIPEQ